MVCLKLGPKFQTRRFDPKLDVSIHKAQRHGDHVVNPHSYPAHLTKNHKGTTHDLCQLFWNESQLLWQRSPMCFPVHLSWNRKYSFILSIFRCSFHGQGKLHYFVKEKFLDTFKLSSHNLI